jgi:rhomboid family GlyGly-CTERM serine protease
VNARAGLFDILKRMPIVSLCTSVLALSLMALPPDLHELLYFDYGHLLHQGNPLGLLSAHWIHVDTEHLFWNLSALLLLGPVIEHYSRALLCWSLVIGTLGVDLLLLSPLSDLQRYCGLSGVLNTLFGVALYLHWRRTRSWLVVVVAVLGVLKIVLEVVSGQAVFTATGWPPFALAHLAGLVGAPLAVGCATVGKGNRPRPAGYAMRAGRQHGCLVTGE